MNDCISLLTFRHTNASEAFHLLQRFINIRFPKYLNYRSKGRGFGWRKYPNKRLYAMGMFYIASGLIEYPERLAQDLQFTMKTVVPPYSGKLNVRWDEKGMGAQLWRS